MSLQTKVIGRTPTDHGPYNPNKSYGKKFCVTLFGCMWESLHDNNNTAPAVWDGGDTITPNLVDWKKVSGDYNAWLMNRDKPAQSADYPFNGMGRVKLLKHVVDGHNLLYQDDFYKDGPNNTRVPNINTVFEVPYEFELAEDITIPANCILEFDGGSISGTFTVDLNNVSLSGVIKLFCKLINPKDKKVCLSWLGIGNTENDAANNTTILTDLATKDIDWEVDVDTIYVNSTITITNRINIYSYILDREKQPTFYFPNSAGLLFNASPYHAHFELKNFRLLSKANAIEFTGYAYDLYITNLHVQSDEGNAFTFASNFQVHLCDCWFCAPQGYGVDNLLGTTSSVTRCTNGPCLAAYHNCITTWISCNGVYNKDLRGNNGITKNWYLWDNPTANYQITLVFVNCNIESVAEIPILSTTTEGNAWNIRGYGFTIHTYKDATTGKRMYPAIKVSGSIRCLEGLYLSGGLDNFDTDVYPIMQGGNIDNYYPLDKFDNQQILYIKANNREGEYSTSLRGLATAKRPTSPMEGFTYYDLTLHKLVLYNGTAWVDATGATV